MKLIYNIYNALLCLLCFFLPFEGLVRAVPNIIVIVLILLFPFLKKNDFKKNIIPLYSFFIAFLVYIVLRSLITESLIEDLFVLKKMGLALLMILLFAPIKEKITIEISFILAVFLSIIISIIDIYKFSSALNEFSFSAGEKINEILIVERLYFGLLCVISFILSIKHFGSQNKLLNGLVILNCVLCFAFVLTISARISLITFVIVIVIQLQKKFRKRVALGLLFLLTIIITAAFFINNNLGKRFFHSNDIYREAIFDKIVTHEPRILIWNCSYTIFKNGTNFFIGNGFKNTKEQLIDCYENTIEKDKKRNWYLQQKFNTHNQFLDFLLSSGFIGLTLFCYSLYFILKQSNYTSTDISLFIALTLFLMIENIFHRQIGVYLFALILILFSNKKTKEIKMKTEND